MKNSKNLRNFSIYKHSLFLKTVKEKKKSYQQYYAFKYLSGIKSHTEQFFAQLVELLRCEFVENAGKRKTISLENQKYKT